LLYPHQNLMFLLPLIGNLSFQQNLPQFDIAGRRD
jgi:hypothetical protein